MMIEVISEPLNSGFDGSPETDRRNFTTLF